VKDKRQKSWGAAVDATAMAKEELSGSSG